MNFLHSFSMGGYAHFVWPAYGFVFFVLVLNLLGTKWQGKRIRYQLKDWFK